MRLLLRWGATLFPFWVLLALALGLFFPWLFTWISGPMIVWGLAIIMLGMGLNLSWEEFRGAFKMPGAVAVGAISQYVIMPFSGFLIADALELPTAFAVGLILVASCPGGTASNIVTFLARANLPLSILMTTVSTFAAALMTPLMMEVYASTRVDVNFWGLVQNTFQVVILPVCLGVLLNRFGGKAVEVVRPASPLIAALTVALIVGKIIGANAEAVWQHAPMLLSAVFLLHVVGFALGYLAALLVGLQDKERRTISIEVGMQNSGLAVVLANAQFQAQPLTAVPGAISAVMHSVIGSILAVWWRFRPAREENSRMRRGQYVMSYDM